MKPILFSTLTTLLLVGLTPCEADDAIYIAVEESKALEAKDGQKVTVYGRSQGSDKSSSGTNFVRFSENDFYLVTFKSDLTEFPDGEPADLFEGKRLAVTGPISLYQGKPQIKLTSPDQVKVLEEEAVFPPAAPDKPVEPTAATEKPMPKPAIPTEEEKPEKPKPPVDPSLYFKKKAD
jgi:hypothetical protein